MEKYTYYVYIKDDLPVEMSKDEFEELFSEVQRERLNKGEEIEFKDPITKETYIVGMIKNNNNNNNIGGN